MKIPFAGFSEKGEDPVSVLYRRNDEDPLPGRISLISRLEPSLDLIGEQFEDFHFRLPVGEDKTTVGPRAQGQLKTALGARPQVDIELGPGTRLACGEDESHEFANEKAEGSGGLQVESEVFTAGDNDFFSP